MHGFLDAAEPDRPHEYGRLSVAFDHGDGLGHSESQLFRRSLALPTRTATDASPIPSREPTHGSRQKWLVTPFLSAGLAPAVHARVKLAHPQFALPPLLHGGERIRHHAGNSPKRSHGDP